MYIFKLVSVQNEILYFRNILLNKLTFISNGVYSSLKSNRSLDLALSTWWYRILFKLK